MNSKHQSMFFSPFIPGHTADEYVNWPHAIHNIAVASCSCLLYFLLCIVLVGKSRSTANPQQSRKKVISNTPVFIQAMLICAFTLIAALVYVYMNFATAPPVLIIAGQVAWQLSHGSPPYIYLTLNKTIRQFVIQSLGFGMSL
ncbi:hypothetical protein PFISCL1PPCAC_13822, partial [Pristionchus fissidentatus]